MPKVSHCNIFCFLRYAHPKYVKCLFTNIHKQWNVLKISLIFTKIQTSRVNNSRVLRIQNAKFSGYCFHMYTIIQAAFQICMSVPLIFHHFIMYFLFFLDHYIAQNICFYSLRSSHWADPQQNDGSKSVLNELKYARESVLFLLKLQDLDLLLY